MEMPSNEYDFCKAFAENDENIMTAAIVEDMKFVARYSKPNNNIPVQQGAKFQELVIQAEIFVSMARSNIEWFGHFRYVSVSFETHDIILFSLPIGSSNKKPRLFGIRVVRPHDMTKILAKLRIH